VDAAPTRPSLPRDRPVRLPGPPQVTAVIHNAFSELEQASGRRKWLTSGAGGAYWELDRQKCGLR
jgi:hypothetical protein